MLDSVQITKVHDPFRRLNKDILFMPCGQSLAQIKAALYPDGGIDIVTSTSRIGVVNDLDLMTYCPQPGESVVFIPDICGGDDSKPIIQSIVMIGLAIAMPYVAGGLIGAGGFGAYGATVAAGELAGAVLSASGIMAGGLIMNSLMPTATPDLPTIDTASFDRSQTYAWQPQTIQQQGTVKPIMYGPGKSYGNVKGTYIENIDNQQFLNVLISLGIGPINKLSDFEICDQPVQNLQGVEIVTRYGRLNQTVIPSFNDTRISYAMSTLVAHTHEVLGTDGNIYRCKQGHTSTNNDKPVTGVNYATYWEKSYDKWVTGTSYTKNTSFVVCDDGNPTVYQCIADHVAGATTRPVSGASWSTKWRLYRTVTAWSLGATFVPRVIYTTTGVAFDGIEVDISSPALYWANDLGGLSAAAVDFKIEISPHGTGAWRSITENVVSTTLVTYGRWSAGYWVQAGEEVFRQDWNEVAAGSVNYDDHKPGDIYDPTDAWNRATWRWIDGTTTEATADLLNDYTAIAAAQNSAVIRTFKSPVNLPHGQYDIMITRMSADSTNSRLADAIYLVGVREVLADDFAYPKEVLVAVRALASSQISGSFKFACLREGKLVRTYSGGVWSIGYSTNNAWVCYDVLSKPVLIDPWEASHPYELGDYVVPSTLNTRKYVCTTAGTSGATEPASWDTTVGHTVSDNGAVWTCEANVVADGVHRFDGTDPTGAPIKLNLTAFSAWAAHCDELVDLPDGTTEKRHEFGGSFDTQIDVWTAAMKVCEAGEAILVWNGTEITVAIDEAATAVQLFGMGNIVQGSFKETFLPWDNRAAEIEIDFSNENKNYDRDSFRILNPNIDTTNKVSKQMIGPFRESEIWRHGARLLKQNELQIRSVQFDADMDAIASSIGDVINFSHDVPQWGNSGRVVSGTTNTVTLDQSVTIGAGTYSVMIRHQKGHEVKGTDNKYYRCKLAHTAATGNRPVSGASYTTYWELSTPSWVTSTPYDTRSYIVGTDLKKYHCISPHTSSAANRPTSGANWALYWELDSTGLTWTTGTAYIPPGTVTTRTVTTGPGTVSTLTVSANFEPVPQQFDLFAFGLATTLVKPYRFMGIQQSQDQKFQLTCAEYDPNMYTELDAGYTVLPAVNYSALNILPLCTSLEAFETLWADASGTWKLDIQVSFIKPVSSLYQYAKIYMRDLTNSGVWTYLGNAYESPFVGGRVNLSTQYEIAVCTVNSAGVEMKIQNAPTVTYSVPATPTHAPVPPDVGTITALAIEDGVVFTWAPVSNPYLDGYSVRTKVNAGSWSSWETVKGNLFERDLTAAEMAAQGKGNSTVYIEVKAVDGFAQTSATATAANGVCQNQKPYITVGTTYVGGNFTSIEDALAAINTAGGGSVVIKNGTYNLAGVVTVPNVDGELIGESVDGVIIRNVAGSNGLYFHNFTKKFKLSNFTLQSQNVASYSYMIYILGDTAAQNTSNITISGLKLDLAEYGGWGSPVGDRGIYGNNGSGGRLLVEKCQSSGGLSPCSAVSYENVVVQTNQFVGSVNTGIYVGSCHGALVQNNIIDQFMYYGIIADNTGGNISMNRLTMLDDSGADAVSVLGIYVSGNEVLTIGNMITLVSGRTNITAVGIRANGIRPVIQGDSINIAIASTKGLTGIDLWNATDGIMNGNRMTLSNTDATTLHRGIWLTASLRSVISSNQIDMVNSHATKDVGMYLDANSLNNHGFSNKIVNAGVPITDRDTTKTNAIEYNGLIIGGTF